MVFILDLNPFFCLSPMRILHLCFLSSLYVSVHGLSIILFLWEEEKRLYLQYMTMQLLCVRQFTCYSITLFSFYDSWTSRWYIVGLSSCNWMEALYWTNAAVKITHLHQYNRYYFNTRNVKIMWTDLGQIQSPVFHPGGKLQSDP